MARRNALLLAAAVLIAVLPLLGPGGGGATFPGSDERALALIAELDPDYRRWAAPLWEPPSSEIASLLFALQAALGAGVLGYCLGLRRGGAKPRRGAAGDEDR